MSDDDQRALREAEERAVERRDVTDARAAFAAKVALFKAAGACHVRWTAARAELTGYLFFCADFCSEVKEMLEDLLEDGEKLKPKDIEKELAAHWNALSNVERAEWNAKAADINAAINQNTTKAGMVTRKKYKRQNKTKRNKRQKKRYTKKYNMRY